MVRQRPILPYQRPLPRRSLKARLFWWSMIAVAGLLFVAGVTALLNPVFQLSESLGGGTLGTPAAPIWHANEENYLRTVYLAEALMYLALFLVMQWLFLIPQGHFRLDRIGGGSLTRRSAIAAGFVAMLLTIGLIATIMAIPGWWRQLTLVHPGAGTEDPRQSYWPIWIVMIGLWSLWAWVFWIYGRSLDRFTALTRILRCLIAGTLLELMVAAPVHAWLVAHHDEDCYCTRGSYTGVVFGCTAMVWVFGPGIVLLMMRELRRRERLLAPPPRDHPISNSIAQTDDQR